MKTVIEQARDMLRDIESMSSNAEEYLTLEDIRLKLIDIMNQASYDASRIINGDFK